ncbi:hypothetical protein [Cyanobacterium sp. Dongsha4]|uniref:hypothetical protein n=1 Tax=Cyanobacterium sp. DS4 TaxID=2878255 RepID=UPI002E820790|nr:hypothetical protein [Cyanobacterium sp. Dongsha4]WVK99514.1 hypothetical protein Dongsha4_12585 [Cyanobacterium sp. Dongsha4]
MVLNKLFGKKKDNYFFEAENKNTNETETQVEGNQTETTVSEGDAETNATPAVSASQKDVAYEVPDWVKAIKNYSSQDTSNNAQSQGENYAGKYVTNNVPFSRRRPGPSLKPFKGMASKIGK